MRLEALGTLLSGCFSPVIVQSGEGWLHTQLPPSQDILTSTPGIPIGTSENPGANTEDSNHKHYWCQLPWDMLTGTPTVLMGALCPGD